MTPPRRLSALLALAVLPAAASVPSGEAARARTDPGAGRDAVPAARAVRPDPRSLHHPDADSVEALVERARGLRDTNPAGAASLYGRAARRAEPGVAAWLRLSEAQAAALAGDTATVRAAARRLAGRTGVPRDSVRLALARAALEAGDAVRGAELGRSLDGAADPALWSERLGPALLAAGDTAAARRGLLEAAGADPDAGAGEVLLALEPDWRTLARLARADREGDRPVRAVRLLARALEAAPAGERAGLWEERAGAELDAGRPSAAHRSARRGLEVVRDPAARAELELLSARTHFARAEAGQAEVHLRRGLAAGGGEPSARAGYLLADLAQDRDRTAEARERYRRVAGRLPGTRHGGIARMRLGLLAHREGRHARAVEHFRAYRRARPGGGWATASVYWEGRALAATGRVAAGEARLRAAMERDPTSWYGIRAAHRLGREPLAAVLADGGPAAAGGSGGSRPSDFGGRRLPGREAGAAGGREADPVDQVPLTAAAGVLLERMDRLRRLGWTERALVEWAAAGVDSLSGGRPLELAAQLNDAGWTAPGIRLGWSVFERRGRWSRRLVRVIWPLPHREAVRAAARRHSIPPALVAAVARQESGFDPRAISRAGAVGLMQIMPATARELAGAAQQPDALMEPGVSLELGAGYLSELLARFDGSVLAALAAYNAGPTRWRRWRRFPEADVDPELLVERIPFGETRRYVKAVLRNVYLYASLYGLDDGGRPPAAPTG